MQTKNKIILVAIGAVIFSLSVFGKYFWWTGLFGLVPLFYVLTVNNKEKPLKINILLCLLFGLIFYGISMIWLWPYGWYAYVGSAVYLSLFLIPFGALFHFFVLKGERVSPFSQALRFFYLTFGVALLWTSCDFLRGFSFQWYSLFHLASYDRPLIQYTSYLGPYFLDFVIAYFDMCLVYFIIKKYPPKTFSVGITEEFLAFLGVFVFIIMHICALGFLNAPLWGDYKVSIAQGSLDMWEKTDREAFRTYKSLIESIKDDPHVILLPETTFSILSKGDKITRDLEKLAKDTKIPIIVGANTESREEGLYNSAVLISKEGVWQSRQNKMKLVPYGEYVPKILPFKNSMMREIDAVPGNEIVPLKPAGGDVKIGCAICFDSSFPWFFAKASKDCNVFAVISNDWWFGKGFAPENHYMMSVLRAVENRRYLLRCGSNGISGVITPYGETLSKTKLDQVVVLSDSFGINNDRTFYAKHRDKFPLAVFFIWLLIIPPLCFFRMK